MKEELTERRYKRNMPFLEKVENAINRMIFDPLIDAILPEDEATENPEPPETTPNAIRSEPPHPGGSSPDARAANTRASQADQGSDGDSGGGSESGSGG